MTKILRFLNYNIVKLYKILIFGFYFKGSFRKWNKMKMILKFDFLIFYFLSCIFFIMKKEKKTNFFFLSALDVFSRNHGDQA